LVLRTRRMSEVLASVFGRGTAALAEATQLRSEIRQELLQIAAAEGNGSGGIPEPSPRRNFGQLLSLPMKTP